MKKLCLTLVWLLILAAVPAQALGAQTVLTSEVSLPSQLAAAPEIRVTVPQTGRIVINPYGLPTEIGGGTTTEQIASETLTISNASEVPVVVSASAEGRISDLSDMTFTYAPPAADAQEKQIFLYAEFQDRDALWSGSYSGGGNQILVSGGVSETKDVLTLDAGPSEGVFRMFGAVSESPVNPWSTDDSVSVTITFTFSPADSAAGDQAADAWQTVPEAVPAPEADPALDAALVPDERNFPDPGSGAQNGGEV